MVGQRLRRLELAAALAIHPDEVRVTEGALRGRAILLAAGPEVASGEAAEDRRGAGAGALALQGVEDLLHPSPFTLHSSFSFHSFSTFLSTLYLLK